MNNIKKRPPEDDEGGINDKVKLHDTNLFSGDPQKKTKRASQTAQPPNPWGFHKWKSVKTAKPIYYQPINIWDGNVVLYNWHRVNDGEKDYYVNDATNDVKTDVTHWSYPFEANLPDADPMTTKDLPGYDLKEIIKAMRKRIKSTDINEDNAKGYVWGIEDCIQIVERRLKKITKPQQLKLHSRNTRT
jgi:hypothetical protein